MGPQRRNEITPVDARLVLGIAVISGVIAAAAGCRPTGAVVIDAGLCAVAAAFVTWLGASAPWWALFAAAGAAGIAAAAGGSLLLVLVAWFALGAAGWIAARRANRPPLRAGVAAVVVQVAFRLDWNPFFLASALVAAVLIGLLLIPGLRRRPGWVRRRVLIGAGAVVVAALAASIGFGISAAQARPDASRGYGLMLDGLEFVEAGDTARAATILRDAAGGLSRASDALAAPWSQPARLVPGIAQNRNAFADVVDRAGDAALAAAGALDQVDIDQLRVRAGVVDLAAFDLLRTPLRDLERTVTELRDALAEARSDWLVAPLQNRFATAERRAEQVHRQTAGTAMLAELGPDLLGRDGPRRYFIAFVNTAEARSTGGLMGNWAEVTVDGGALRTTAEGRTAELQRGVVDRGPVILDQPDWFFERYGYWELGGPDSPVGPNAWVNAPLSPDMPTVGSVYAQLYEAATGRAVDGVLVIDPAGLAALLDVVGPIELPEAEITLTGANAERFLVLDQYEFVESEREDLLEAVSEAAVDRILTTTLPAPHEMARRLADAALEGHLLAWAPRAEEQEFFTFVGMEGALPRWSEETWADVLAVTVNNSSGNKIESFLEREIRYLPVHDPSSGRVDATLEITLRNTAPTTGYADYVVGNIVGLPVGTNRMLLEVFSPLAIGDLAIDGVPQYTTPGRESGLNTAMIGVEIPAGGTVVVTATLNGTVAGGAYELIYRPQALPRGDRLMVDGRSGAQRIEFDGPVARRTLISSGAPRAWR